MFHYRIWVLCGWAWEHGQETSGYQSLTWFLTQSYSCYTRIFSLPFINIEDLTEKQLSWKRCFLWFKHTYEPYVILICWASEALMKLVLILCGTNIEVPSLKLRSCLLMLIRSAIYCQALVVGFDLNYKEKQDGEWNSEIERKNYAE